MNWDAVKVITDGMQFVMLLGIGYMQWLHSRRVQAEGKIRSDLSQADTDLREDLENTKASMQELETRTTRVEEKVHGAPTHNDLGNVYRELNKVSTELSTVIGELKSATRQLQLLHEDRLQQGGSNRGS